MRTNYSAPVQVSGNGCGEEAQMLRTFGSAIMAVLMPSSAIAQEEVRSVHGDWQLQCPTSSSKDRSNCAIVQSVKATGRQDAELSVHVLKAENGKGHMLRVSAPMGVLLPWGLGLDVDGKDQGRVEFVKCDREINCVAEVIADDELLNRLISGRVGTFVVFLTPDEHMMFRVSLRGFTAGINALP